MPSTLLLLALVLLITGCSSDDGPVRLSLWHVKDSAERTFLEDAVARYQAEHPDVQVDVLYKEPEEMRNHFVIASVGGQGPEIVYGPADNASIFAITEATRPLETVFDPAFFDAFIDGALVSWAGDTVLVADQIGNHLAFVYNKALMPEPPRTLDELVAVARELTQDTNGDGRPDQYGLTWNYTEPFFFIPFLTAHGGWVMDDEGTPTLDNARTVEAVQFILDLRDEFGVIPRESDYNVAETLFKEGRAAAIINGPWAWAGYGDAGIDYGIARIPFNTDTGQWAAPMTSARGYSINANVPDEKLPYVTDLIRFLTGEAIQREMAARLATIPVQKAVVADSVVQANPILQASLAQVEVGRAMPLAPQMRQVWDGMRGPYQLVMNGAVSAERGAELMQAETEKRIADALLANEQRNPLDTWLPLIALGLGLVGFVAWRRRDRG